MPFLNGYGKGTKEVLRERMNYAINDQLTWALGTECLSVSFISLLWIKPSSNVHVGKKSTKIVKRQGL